MTTRIGRNGRLWRLPQRSYAPPMSRRTPGMLATLALIAAGLVALGGGTGPATAVDNVVPFCSDSGVVPPCLDSFTVDGSKPLSSLYRVEWQEQMPGSGFYSWYVEKFHDGLWQVSMGDGDYGKVFAT